jgi:hypothetical protein
MPTWLLAVHQLVTEEEIKQYEKDRGN